MAQRHKIGFVIFASAVSQHLYMMYFCSWCDVPIFFTLNTQRMLSEIRFSELCPSIIVSSFRRRSASFIVQSFFFVFLVFIAISVSVCCDASANFANFLMWNRRHKNISHIKNIEGVEVLAWSARLKAMIEDITKSIFASARSFVG